jgi:hypothetical protein
MRHDRPFLLALVLLALSLVCLAGAVMYSDHGRVITRECHELSCPPCLPTICPDPLPCPECPTCWCRECEECHECPRCRCDSDDY